ncbi:Hsp20/alpha crystallin family protein [Halococcus dombrowskii]|uniref:Hsp20/alpha crystallin family protein n=1 Tax=Halococcus dombrowskii TaxID=179637 RepID=A0AAV3SGH3_HALDO|nr:Hsp20/alpha crystallin family protein [Halococcus dombrowskii]UOO93857.1 Hsp20/alpha crystallin family protein [Halococcus dombrowskii]
MSSSVGESVLKRVLDGVGRFAGRAQERRPLATDLLESDDAYLVVFDAPDASAEDVQVRFSERAVHVRIDRTREHREGFEMRFPGRGLSLDGSVTLPTEATVDPDAASASLTGEGTLEVELPKVEDADDGPIRISTDEDETGDDGTVEDTSAETDEETTDDDVNES